MVKRTLNTDVGTRQLSPEKPLMLSKDPVEVIMARCKAVLSKLTDWPKMLAGKRIVQMSETRSAVSFDLHRHQLKVMWATYDNASLNDYDYEKQFVSELKEAYGVREAFCLHATEVKVAQSYIVFYIIPAAVAELFVDEPELAVEIEKALLSKPTRERTY